MVVCIDGLQKFKMKEKYQRSQISKFLFKKLES